MTRELTNSELEEYEEQMRFDRDREREMQEQEREMNALWLDDAKRDLAFMRRVLLLDVSLEIKQIHDSVTSGYFTLEEIGTSEEELAKFLRKGFLGEAEWYVDKARYVYEHSAIYRLIRGLWVRSVRLFKRPSYLPLKLIFKPAKKESRSQCIAKAREWLAKANASPTDVGSSEGEMIKLES